MDIRRETISHATLLGPTQVKSHPVAGLFRISKVVETRTRFNIVLD